VSFAVGASNEAVNIRVAVGVAAGSISASGCVSTGVLVTVGDSATASTVAGCPVSLSTVGVV
jgi:hypothetical protein